MLKPRSTILVHITSPAWY